MSKFRDPVALRNPKLPGVVITKDRRSVPAYKRRGWVERKSPAAQPVVEDSTSDKDDNPSKESS